jgi:rod shape-determining protein MreD
MKSYAFLKASFVFFLLVVLHYTVRPLIGTRVSVDFLVIAVLLNAVHVRPGFAALIGFATGLVADSLSPLSFGAGALAMSAVGFSASWLKATVFGDNLFLQAVFFAAGKWAFDVLYLVAERRLGPGDMTAQLLLWSPLSAVLTGIAGVLIVVTFRLSMESRR